MSRDSANCWQAEQVRQGVRQGGLADPGQILDQQVPPREQAGERQPDLVFLAEDDRARGGEDVGER